MSDPYEDFIKHMPLGELVRMGRTEAQMADGRWGEVELTEAVDVTLVAGVARRTVVPMLVRGETVLLGATVLAGMDLVVDGARGRLVPMSGPGPSRSFGCRSAAAMDANTALYHQDLDRWGRETAALLRQGRLTEVDLAAVAEELDSLGGTIPVRMGTVLQALQN